MKSPLLRSLPLFAALASVLAAQTWTGAVSRDWNDPANWNPASVPADPGATAIFTAAGLDPQFSTDISTSSDWTLGGIVFAADARPVTLYAGEEGESSEFALVGTGLQNNSAVSQRVWLTAPSFDHTYGISLTFRNQATVAGDVRLIAIGDNRLLLFHDQSSAGTANIASYDTRFYDDSTAGSASFDQTMGALVLFTDQATAGTAKLPGHYGSVTFAGSSSAAGATIQRPDIYGSSQVFFRDDSTAAASTVEVYALEFSGRATAGQARLSDTGVQYYSSHGMYATQFAAATFREWSRAGSATIAVNSLGSLVFTDDASAEQATITSTGGNVVFSERAWLKDAVLRAGTGTMYVNQFEYYNQPARLTTVGRVTFKDQAGGGAGVIELTSPDVVIDFSGLGTRYGGTGRAPLPANPAGAAIVADDSWQLSLGTLTNTAPGGTIYLGSTQLWLGFTNSSMNLSALIKDTGGAYGSLAGEPLKGGALGKTGTGTLTISNPNNDYSGPTTVTRGTLDLDGGRINNATIANPSRLTGTGTVRGYLVNAGTVSPGHSPGTITVTGDYTQDPLGTLQIELNSATVYDRLVVAGHATLAGTLALSTPAGFAPLGNTTFNFLTAGSLSGTFDTVTSGTGFGAALTTQLVYGPAGLGLQVTQHPFAGFGGDSPAAAALGAQFDATLAGATGDHRALLAGLNTLDTAAEIGAALESLAPDRYATLAENGFLTAAVQQAAQDRRFAAARADRTARGFNVFFEGGQHRAEFDAVPGLPAAESTLAGGTGGVAWQSAAFTFGAGVTQASGDAGLDTLGSRADLESTAPAVFFQYAGDRFFVNAAATFSNDDYELQRRVAYTGATALATAAGSRRDLAVTVGRTFRAGRWTLTPQAGLLASEWRLDGFTETGAAGANLTLPAQSLRSLRTRVGVDGAMPGPHFAPRFSVAWLHETEADRALSAAFAGGPAYAAPGRPAARDLVQASAGFDWLVTPRGAFYVTGAGAWGDGASVTSDFSAGFRWRF